MKQLLSFDLYSATPYSGFEPFGNSYDVRGKRLDKFSPVFSYTRLFRNYNTVNCHMAAHLSTCVIK